MILDGVLGVLQFVMISIVGPIPGGSDTGPANSVLTVAGAGELLRLRPNYMSACPLPRNLLVNPYFNLITAVR